MSLPLVLLGAFIFLLLVVGGYVYMFLHIMRNDPREQNYRDGHGHDSGLVPKNKD